MTDETTHIARQAAALDERGMPQTVWLHADGTINDDPPTHYWEAQPYVRSDLARAKIDRLSETCGYAISQWEDWVRDQLEGTSKFDDAMAEIEATRAAVTARPSLAGDERVARLVEAARDVIEGWEWWTADEYDRDRGVVSDGIHDLTAALSAMNTPAQGGEE